MIKKSINRAVALTVIASMTGCATGDLRRQGEQNVDIINTSSKDFPAASASSNRRPVEFNDGAYLSRKAVPVVFEKTLPPVFARPYENPATLMNNGTRASLGMVAERLTQTFGIPVEIDANVFTRPVTVTNSAGKTGTVNADTGNGLGYDDERNIALAHFKGPLSQFLDQMTTRLGISWEYDNSRIRFFRYKARIFEIKAIGGSKRVSSNFSSTGQSSATGGGGGDSSSVINVSQSQESKLNFWESVSLGVQAMLSSGGRLVPNESSGTITVVDTPQVLRAVERYLEEENRRVGRSVYLKVEMYTMTATTDAQLGADLATVFTSGNGITTSTPIGSVVSGTGTGSVVARLTGGKWKDTFAALSARQGSSTVTSKASLDAYTVNNHPVPFTIAATQSYIDSVGTSQSNVSSQVTVTQKQLTTGVFLELLPHVLDSNRMLLQYTIDVSSDPDFQIIDNGGSAGTPKIQSPRVARKSTSQTVNIRPGDTLVLTQLGKQDNNNRNAFGLTGASMAGDSKKEATIILITPVVIDSDI
jgi:type IVB pilus formation R64 PilN family outer membrane protein